MRLKSYIAPTISKAMDLVKKELGSDALIMQTLQEKDGTIRIVAAAEEKDDHLLSRLIQEQVENPHIKNKLRQRVEKCLSFHGMPEAVFYRMQQTLQQEIARKNITHHDDESVEKMLSAVLKKTQNFRPTLMKTSPLVLVGPPGVGKTVTIAKLAAMHLISGNNVRVITTDVIKSGAIDQLKKYTKMMNLETIVAHDAEDLASLVKSPYQGMTLVDTPGVNPFDESDIKRLARFVVSLRQPPTLVLSAGFDAREVEDIARPFFHLGASQLIATRLDLARRLGSIFAAIDSAQLTLCAVSQSPLISKELILASPEKLAKIMIDAQRSRQLLAFQKMSDSKKTAAGIF